MKLNDVQTAPWDEQPDEQQQQPQEPVDSFAEQESMVVSKSKGLIASILSGNILSKAEVKRTYPYLLLISFLVILYISNVFRMQQLHQKHDRLEQKVKELRAKSMSLTAEKMTLTRESEIIKMLKERGIELHQSTTPHSVIEK